MNKNKLRTFFIITFIMIAVVLSVFLFKNKPLSVDLASLEGDIVIEVYGLGSVEAKVISSIGFEVGAALIELNADHGDVIKKGAILARLNCTEQEAKVARAAADVDAAKAQLKRAEVTITKIKAILTYKKGTNKRSKALLPRKAISLEEAEQTQMDEDVAAADLKISQSEVLLAAADLVDAQAQYDFEKVLLEQHILRAPYDALVIERHKELGSVLSAGEPVFTLVDPATIWVLGYIDEAHAGHVTVGQSVRVHLRSLPHSEFNGKVTRIDIESDRVSEERRVYITCNNCPKKFSLGEQAEVFVQVATLDQALMIPEIIIEQFDGTNGSAWVVEKGQLRQVSVTFGHKTLDGRVEVISDLDAGTNLITNRPIGLREGRRVFTSKGL